MLGNLTLEEAIKEMITGKERTVDNH